MLPFILTLSTVALLLWGSLRWAVNEGRLALTPTFSWEIIVFLYAITLVVFVYLYRGRKRGHFLSVYLLTMVVKMVASLVFAFWMVLTERADAAANLSFFLITYVIFTGLEIGFLYPLVTRDDGT